MRIAHLVLNGEIAGGQVVALQLADAARDAGHEAFFVVPTPGPFRDLVPSHGFEAHVIPVRGSFDLRAVAALRRALRGVDVLHTHAMIEVNAVARVAARLARVPVVSHMHIENFVPRGARGVFVRALDNATARLSTRIVAVSEDTRRALLRQGYPDRIAVIPNGVELAPESDDPGEGVVEVARLAPVKGQRELIEAVARIDGARLTLVGADLERGGAYADELRELAERIAPGRVELTGRRDDAKELLARAAVVALPSTTEGLPMTLLEAMARSRAVVATPVGGTPEVVVAGETGLLVPVGDVEALETALRALLADPAERTRLGRAGRERVAARFDLARTAARFLELYAELGRRADA